MTNEADELMAGQEELGIPQGDALAPVAEPIAPDATQPIAGIPLDADDFDDEDDEFDLMVARHLRTSLDAAGPSVATEGRILSALFAAAGIVPPDVAEVAAPAVAEVEAKPAPLEEPALEPVPAAVPQGAAQASLLAEGLPLVRPELPKLTTPVAVQGPAAAEGLAVDAAVARLAQEEALEAEAQQATGFSVFSGPATTSDLSDVSARVTYRNTRRLQRRFVIYAAAACVAAVAVAVGIPALRSKSADMMPAGGSVSLEATNYAEEADVDAYVPEPEPEAEYEESGEVAAEDKAMATADAGGADGAEMPTDAFEVTLSTGETLRLVMSEGAPREVDSAAVGEFVEQATAVDAEGNESPCEVYRLIAQSDEDLTLYAVHFGNEGIFYLAMAQ